MIKPWIYNRINLLAYNSSWLFKSFTSHCKVIFSELSERDEQL
ncbi:hypothetical protein AF47_04738 [Klebsiella aerogenes MGH 61]|nr:hypothetical protein AF47_04738 [Klebsiella aerogenes MGH 61]